MPFPWCNLSSYYYYYYTRIQATVGSDALSESLSLDMHVPEEVQDGHKGLLSLTCNEAPKLSPTMALPPCLNDGAWVFHQDLLHFMVSAHVASSSQPSTDEAAKEIRRLAAKYAWWWDAHKRDAEPTTIYRSIDAAVTSG